MCDANVLFILTGSIAGYKACEAISRLVQAGYRVRTVATESALRFVGAPTLEGLTGTPVRHALWESGQAMEHIHLTRWADVVIVCPATAHTLNRFAAGMADDLAGALWMAHDRTKPWLMAPAMNPAMWSHPATQAAVGKLRDWGVQFLPVGAGRTACGESGEGRMAEPAAIVSAVAAALARPGRRLRVLVTSGGTAESLDGVRVLTNTSTGQTGAGLAEHFTRCGHAVTLLRAATAVAPAAVPRQETFSSFGDLDDALGRLLGGEEYDIVIHAAAVGDFAIGAITVDGIVQPRGAKLASTRPVLLELRPQPKLLAALRARSRNPGICIVAFKLTTGVAEAEARAAREALFAEAAPDFVVHNDLAARGAAFPADIHPADGSPPVHCADRTELAVQLESLLTATPSPA